MTIPHEPLLRLLLSVPERHPTFRADVAVLFGKYLPRRGIRSDLVTCRDAAEPAPWPGGEQHTLHAAPGGIGRHWGSLRADLRLPALARRGCDMVVVRDKTLGAVLGLWAARRAGVPFVYWMSFPMVEAWAEYARERGRSTGLLRWAAAWARGHLMQRLLYRWILPAADLVFVQSDAMRAAMRCRGLPAERLVAVPMGVDAEAMAGEGTQPDLQAPTFGYLGTLNRMRQPQVLIEAFAQLHRQHPQARLLLIGDADNAPDRAWLRQRIAAAGPAAARIELTGWLPTQEGWRRLRGCVAGLATMPRSAIFDVATPTKVGEYFFLGLPVIANDQPDQAALLAEAGGRCVPLTPGAFAAAMHELLRDPAPHRAVAQRGRQLIAQRRTYAALSGGVAQALLSLHERHSHPGPVARHAGRVLMLGPGLANRGGIASVAAEYERAGLLRRLGVHYLSTFEQGGPLRKLAAAAGALGSLVARLVAGRVDLLHVHVATRASFWRKAVYCALARGFGVPVLLHLHSGDMPAFVARSGPLARWLILRTLRSAWRVVVLSPEWQQWLQRLDPRLRSEVLPNPVAVPAETPAVPRAGPPSVLFLGRIEPAKGVPELLQAFAQVRRVLPDAVLHLCGEGAAADLEQRLDALGLRGAVKLPGWVAGAAKDALLHSAWVFALPSHHEGLPVGMLEAMAHGLPVVGTPVGAVPGLVDSSGGGLLVPVGDADALAQALLLLLRDADRRARLGRAAQAHVRAHCGTDRVEQRLRALYDMARRERIAARGTEATPR